MRWLVHGNLSEAVTTALTRHGHEASRPADIGIAPGATAEEVLDAARKKQLDLITADADIMSAALADSHRLSRSVVHIQLDGAGDVEQDDAIDRLFARYKRLAPDQLYTVTHNRVKVRQLPKHLRRRDD